MHCNDACCFTEHCIYLQYLAGLLIHRRLALDFVKEDGVRRLIAIDRESIASAAVGTCLYYLSCCTDAMEGVCMHPDSVVVDVVK